MQVRQIAFLPLLLFLLLLSPHIALLPVFPQVKQQKKSGSSKWTCAVCNEKQSVRKVFARSSLARDVRTFVQSFNLAHGNLEDGATLANSDSTPQPSGSFQKQKRTDWTEYLDRGEGDEGKGVSEALGFESEIEVVTELPKQLWKPVFAKRKRRESHDSNKYQKIVAKQPSKWSHYLETEENEMFQRERDSCNSYYTWGGKDVSQSQFNDQRVEEDIHPDFI
ncbi:hypothetical protein ACLOJK_019818 [Asimina triloba]